MNQQIKEMQGLLNEFNNFVPEYISLILFGVFAGLFYYLSHLLKEGAFGIKVDKNVSVS